MGIRVKSLKLREADFQAQVINYAQLHGWRVAHFRVSRTKTSWATPVAADGKGFPDLLLIRGEREVVAELKIPGNTTTPEQDEWLAAFRQAGREAFIWYPKDWAEIERVLA